MKKPLEEAAEIFRQSQAMFGDARQDLEKASFYRGLALMAEGLLRMDRRVEGLRSETEESPPLRRRIRTRMSAPRMAAPVR